MYKKNLRKMQTQTQEILSWFSPCDLRPVPTQPAWDFSYPDFDTPPKLTHYTLLDKTAFAQSVQLSLHQEDKNSLNECNESYKPWILYVMWTRSLIGRLPEFFTIGLELWEEQKVEASF